MDSTMTQTRIAICLITRQRPKGLARTLASLDAVSVPDDCLMEVVVIDNDDPDAASGAPLPTVAGQPVLRVDEPRPGIPFARNRAIEVARTRADLLAFIDDDETVEPDWLEKLMAVRAEYRTDIVTGPALPRLPDSSPAWAERSGVYGCHRYPTGSERPWAFTHNVLASTALFDDPGFRFDETMQYTGASDTQLFRRLREGGHRIIWADEAIAWEWYPESRVNFKWAFARSYRIGVTDAHMELRRNGRLGTKARLVWLATRYGVRGALRGAIRILRPATALACCGWDVARGIGLIGGIFGVRYDEYRTIHGE
jgi:succinoglycan biosynthesis protein ExoM